VTEKNQVNEAIATHLRPLGLWRRWEGVVGSGQPDWDYWLRRQHGWLEAKILPASGNPPDHLTLEQILWAEEEVRWGGRWHLLGKRLAAGLKPAAWLLYDVAGARAWLDGTANRPVLMVTGPFPRDALVEALAPLGSSTIRDLPAARGTTG